MDDRLLRTTLTANALVSGAAAVAMIAMAGVLDEPLGIAAPVLVAVGAGLLPWAVMLWRARSRDVLLPRDAVTAIAGDVAWVLASLVVVATSPGGLTAAGQWVVGVMALGVADFAVLQAVGLRRMRSRQVRPGPTGRRPAVR